MIYNPVFEEETDRQEQMKTLKDAIRSRATKHYVIDLAKKLFSFGRSHPIATFATVVGLLGFGFSGKKD